MWTYDNAGNILTRKEYSYTTGTPGTPLDTVTYAYGNNQWGDLLTAYDGNGLQYDAIGNLTRDGAWTYTWEHGRQLASMTGNGTTWSYTYDADGMRTSRSSGSTAYSYIYNGGQLTQMTVGSNTLLFTYDASGSPQTVVHNGTPYYYVTNLQGDVTAILDGSGDEVVAYTYDAWGKILDTSGDLASTLGALNPLRYRGYVYDQETKLYYLQSRYYNPITGRFLNADALASTGQGLLGNNMFAYCGNNPVCNADYLGLAPKNVLLPVCLGGNGSTFSFESSADEDVNSQELLEQILSTVDSNYTTPQYGRLRSISVKRDGTYESEFYFLENLVLGLLGIGVCFVAPPVGTYVGVTIASIGVFNLIGQEIDNLPNEEYAKYTITTVWESTKYQNGKIVYIEHIFTWILLYNNTKVDNPSWYCIGQSYESRYK